MIFSKHRPVPLSDKAPPNPTSEKSEIRVAHLSDIKDILCLTIKHRQLGYLPALHNGATEFDDSTLKATLYSIITSREPIFVSVNNKGLTGFIFGRICESMWSKGARVLEHYGFYAETKRAGHNLLVRYLEVAEDLKQSGAIKCYIMTEMIGVSPDYSRFNMRPIERRWISWS